MSGFKMDDYVDVAERIRAFHDKYPDGSLQSELSFHSYEAEDFNQKSGQVVRVKGAGWLCTASAYRNADDTRPGIGHAFEPVPGKTPYTRDSEAMNAETSAWGRAIVALGFETKKIASADEVKARQPEKTVKPAQEKQDAALEEARDALQSLADQLGAGEATADAISRHKGDPTELAWLRRQIAAAEKNVKAKEAA